MGVGQGEEGPGVEKPAETLADRLSARFSKAGCSLMIMSLRVM